MYMSIKTNTSYSYFVMHLTIEPHINRNRKIAEVIF